MGGLSPSSVTLSNSRPRVRVLCLPDVDRAIGGVKQLYRHVEHLVALGWDAAMLTEKPGFRPAWFESSAPSLSLQESSARGELDARSCVLLVPETYLAVAWNHFWGIDLSGLARVVFNQNAYYSYGSLGDQALPSLVSFYDHPAVLQVLSISEDTHQFLSQNVGIPDRRLNRIVNAIEPMFSGNQPKSNRLHWMPRKNPEHVQAVLFGMQRCGLRYSEGWQAEPLQQLSHQQVADRLNAARIFLAFGHPEGFGLPIAEAMAAGCWVVGYSGGGGAELFRFGASCQVAFGDWSAFVAGIQAALEVFALKPRETQLRLHRQALAVSSLYSHEQERASIAAAWESVAEAFVAWQQTAQA
jgi:glycosyltransferase involved in cell wall biosynthesis